MKPLPLLMLLSFTSSKITISDDFIRLSTGQIWKVAECKREKEIVKVKPCYSSEFCEKQYSGKDHSCLRSIACGETYLRESFTRLNIARPNIGEPFLVTIKRPKGESLHAVISTQNTSPESMKKIENKNKKTILFELKEEHQSYDIKSLPSSSDNEIIAKQILAETLTECPPNE